MSPAASVAAVPGPATVSTQAARPARRSRPLTLGVVGGGQLARMLAQAAGQLGCDVVVLARAGPSPAADLATARVTGEPNDLAALLELAARVDVITLENEFVDADHLAGLERAGHHLWPTAGTVRVVESRARNRTLGQDPHGRI